MASTLFPGSVLHGARRHGHNVHHSGAGQFLFVRRIPTPTRIVTLTGPLPTSVLPDQPTDNPEAGAVMTLVALALKLMPCARSVCLLGSSVPFRSLVKVFRLLCVHHPCGQATRPQHRSLMHGPTAGIEQLEEVVAELAVET